MAHRSTPRLRALPALLAALLAFPFAASCTGQRKLVDPSVVVQTDGGRELGVSTEYGIVFTGATAKRGEAEFEIWYGDGPSIERTVIEPVINTSKDNRQTASDVALLFTGEIDIEAPEVSIGFKEPYDGEMLEVMGRRGQRRWSTLARVRTDPRVFGLLLEIPSGFPDDPDQVGAGVFRPLGDRARELVGLVVGKVQLQRGNGLRRYLAVAGPTELWKLAAYRRDLLRAKPFVYREDIL